MSQAAFPLHIMKKFVETLSTEIGHETLTAVLSKAGLPKGWAHSEYFLSLDDGQVAEVLFHLAVCHPRILWTWRARDINAYWNKSLAKPLE